MREISGTIKFTGKKAVTKKELETTTLVETWEQTESYSCKEYFVYKGIKYQLIPNSKK
jgi:hypothetical protein